MNSFETFLQERSGIGIKHPYAYKAAYNYDNGHAIKITYDISVPTFEVCQIGPVGVTIATGKNWVDFARAVALGDFKSMPDDKKTELVKGLRPTNVRAQRETELTVDAVRGRGHLDFTGKGCPVVEILDRVTGQKLQSVERMIGPFSLKKKSPLNIPNHLLEEWHSGKLGQFELFSKGFRVGKVEVGEVQQYPTFLSTHWFDNASQPMRVTEAYAKKFGYELDSDGYAIDPHSGKRILFDFSSSFISNVEFYDFDDDRAAKTKMKNYNAMQGVVIGGQEDPNLSAPGLLKQGAQVLTDRAARPLTTVQITKFDARHEDIIARLQKMTDAEQMRTLLQLKDKDPGLYMVVQHILDYISQRKYVALHTYMNTIKPMWEETSLFEQYLVEAPEGDGPPDLEMPPEDPPAMDVPPADDGMSDDGGAPGLEAPPDLSMGDDGSDDGSGLMGDPNADMSEGEGQDLNQLLNLPEKVSAIMNLKLHERFLNLLNTIGSQLQSIKNNADILNALAKDSIDIVDHLKRLDDNVRLYLKNNFIHENYSKNLLFFNKCLNLLKLLNDAFDHDIHKGIKDVE